MKATNFRKELIKVMPSYKWTVHRLYCSERFIFATGIVTIGFNRMSTLQIIKRKKDDNIEYEAKSSGFGLNSPWLSRYKDITLKRALRGLQNHYEAMAKEYSRHAADLEHGRKP